MSLVSAQQPGDGSGRARLARAAIAAARTVAEVGGGVADDNQRAVLEGFAGWGPVSKLFDAQPAGVWAGLADELEDVAGQEMVSAAQVVDTSFFTPAELIWHIWEVLRAAGFSGGSVLDLGCGSGAFARHAPSDLPITYTGVDADLLSTQIARLLCPGARIITGELQRVSVPHGRFDAAVGNVPFSAARVHDGAIGFYGSLHEYFVARAVAAVRPGGYVVAVTSRHLLDGSRGMPASIGEHADLIAALRLPSGYFAPAGTEVVADVVALRVRDREGGQHGWVPGDGESRVTLTEMVGGRYCREPVSGWWSMHPELVAGTMRLTGFDRVPLAVDAEDHRAALTAAFAAVPPLLVGNYPADGRPAVDAADVALTDEQGRAEGSLHVVDGQVVRVVDGALSVVARASAELRALLGLRDAAVALLAAESDWDRPDGEVEPLRAACRDAYTAYAARYGALNRGVITEGKPDPETGLPRLGWRTPNLGGFRQDPDCPVVLALEVFDQQTGEAGPAPILMRRVNKRPAPAIAAQTAPQALSICLGEGRGLDLGRVAGLLGLSGPEEAFGALGELVYRDPAAGGRAITARDYLCGDVRAKLRDALAAAAVDRRYVRNVAALEAVQPPWLGRNEIRIELGSPFVTASDVADFCAEVFGARARVDHIAPLAAWEVTGSRALLSPQARLAYCTERMDAFALLAIGLNGGAPVVWDEVYDEVSRTRRKVRNADATEAAEQKLAAIAERFSLWVWESPQRELRIVDRYNHTMNAHVLRNHEGSHLTFPGLADGIELWPWQRDFVDRAASTPAVFCSHEVGLGKTYTAITLAMTLRQFGLVNRPAFIVPLHLLEQTTRQAYQAWPSGRFLIVTRDDLHGDARRRFLARCVTGDWDLLIMTHETFSSLPVPAGVEQDWLSDQLADLENYVRAEGYSGKRIASAMRSLRGRIARLRSAFNDPQAITLGALGVDYLIVDEADKFRRLEVHSRAEGFSLGASKRATDLFLKISLLRRANPTRPHVCLMTGTPFTNTLAESYVWQRMLTPDRLAETGLSHFDAWAAQFVRYEVLIETSPDGSGFRSRRRPSVIQNVPELRCMLSEFMSMVRADSVGLPRPAVRLHTEVSEPTEAQRAFMDSLVRRADALRARRVGADVDNMLLICGDGRKVALDPNLVGINEQAPKLAGVARRVGEVYHRTKDLEYVGSPRPGAFQLVLCDLGTPKAGDAQSYGRLRAGMIAAGVPAGMIRFAHEATTTRAREALFAGCRDGRIAVLIGSTAKVGIGVNVQDRLHSIHRVDPPWTPAAWEQGNGRGKRNGNQHSILDIYSYVARRTFDAFMFGTVERKSRGFEQLYRVDGQAREIEDVGGDGTLSFGELKAAAAGNDLLLRQHELATRVRALRLAHITVQQNVRTLLQQADNATAAAEAATARAGRLADFAEHAAGMGEIDMARVAAAALPPRGVDRYCPPSRVGWTDHRVSIRVVDTDAGPELMMAFNYHTLWAQAIPGKIRRRGPAAVAAWAQAVVAAWIAGVRDEIAATRARAVESARAAERARDAASAVDSGEPAELTAARAELEAVNAAIADALSQEGRPAAA